MNTTTSEDSEYETLEEDNGGSSRSSRSRRSSFSEERDELSDDINIEDEREDGDGQEELNGKGIISGTDNKSTGLIHQPLHMRQLSKVLDTAHP
ncbi:hypothetical protein J6590_033024 [Homalodisca vitripennis]|nr:hypothetical protein J6590_033024 [Homalodisca vitripennis]